jgi:hypothetical protein
MKKVLGAIAAAVLLGTGCAHNKENTSQAEVPIPPQVVEESVYHDPMGGSGQAGAASAYNCEVVSTGSAATTRSELKQDECVKKADSSVSSKAAITGGEASEDAAIGGSASGDLASDNALPEESGIGGSASGDFANDNALPEESGIGGSASEDLSTDDSASKNLAPDDSVSEDTSFENTDMGGTGGGGG